MRSCPSLLEQLGAASASRVVALYSRCFRTGETFRDIKDLRFGMGLSAMRIAESVRRDRLLRVCALVLALLGAAKERLGMERHLKANTAKSRTYSLFRQGCFYYRALPMMPEAQLRPRMELFGSLVQEQPVVRPNHAPGGSCPP